MKSINLLPPVQVKRTGRILTVLLVTAFIATIVAQAYGYASWRSNTKKLEGELAAITQESQRLQDQGTPRAQYNVYHQALTLLNRFKSQREDWTPYLDAVVTAIGQDSRILSMALDGQSAISLEIEFPTFDSALAYIQALEANSSLQNVRLKTYSKQVKEETSTKPGSDGQSIITQESHAVFKVLLNMALTKQKGAEADGN